MMKIVSCALMCVISWYVVLSFLIEVTLVSPTIVRNYSRLELAISTIDMIICLTRTKIK